MIQKILNSKNFVACLLAAATGLTLYFWVPFPGENIFLRVMALQSPSIFYFIKFSDALFLFSTPYIGYSFAPSGVYIFTLKAGRRVRAGRLPLFPDPRKRDELFLVLGEVHNPRKQTPAENPQWLVIPERGLFTGVAILGTIGPEFQAWLRYKNANGAETYVSMNTLKPDASTRTKNDIGAIRHLYLDLDHGGATALEAIENSDLVPLPNYVLTASPEKFQVVWKAEGITLEEAEALQHAMVGEFGGNPAATDSTRVLRLPGFANTMPSTPSRKPKWNFNETTLRTSISPGRRETSEPTRGFCLRRSYEQREPR